MLHYMADSNFMGKNRLPLAGFKHIELSCLKKLSRRVISLNIDSYWRQLCCCFVFGDRDYMYMYIHHGHVLHSIV